ncbi:uncharacterized protein LOC134208127 [Armigeres subalbatus]|uniref:uncharacterized protein LOC134208127 n=1 Tax=Armigeres subalbatus TaxID=124917 RepID=UPI002ED160F8
MMRPSRSRFLRCGARLDRGPSSNSVETVVRNVNIRKQNRPNANDGGPRLPWKSLPDPLPFMCVPALIRIYNIRNDAEVSRLITNRFHTDSRYVLLSVPGLDQVQCHSICINIIQNKTDSDAFARCMSLLNKQQGKMCPWHLSNKVQVEDCN